MYSVYTPPLLSTNTIKFSSTSVGFNFCVLDVLLIYIILPGLARSCGGVRLFSY